MEQRVHRDAGSTSNVSLHIWKFEFVEALRRDSLPELDFLLRISGGCIYCVVEVRAPDTEVERLLDAIIKKVAYTFLDCTDGLKDKSIKTSRYAFDSAISSDLQWAQGRGAIGSCPMRQSNHISGQIVESVY